MRIFNGLLVLLATAACALGADATRDETIRKLASENYLERVKATQILWELGPLAIDDLKEAARSTDPEMALRARDLLRKIDLGIAPDTDPRIIKLIERYPTANPTQKNTIFHELRRLRAWRQILRLYAREKNPSTRENLERMVDGIALHAARERLASGDKNGALEYLEMARTTRGGLISIAAFHRATGNLKNEISAASKLNGKEHLAWLTALHRAANDPENAAITARNTGDETLAASMDMLRGNPIPWLNHTASVAAKSQDNPNENYARAAAARWSGDDVKPHLNHIRRLLRSHEESIRLRSVAELILLGDSDAAWRSFTHHFPEEAFSLFDSVENLDEALNTLGIDPENPNYHAHIEPILKRVCQPPDQNIDIDEEDPRENAIRKLVVICSFLEKRGAHEILNQSVAPSILNFATIHQPRFIDLMSQLFGAGTSTTGAPELAMRVANEWAGIDAQRWQEIMIAAFGEEQGFPQWWELLENVAPQKPHSDRLRAMLALFGYTKDPDNLYEKWMSKIWTHIEKSPNPQPAIQSLEFLSTNISDVELIEKIRNTNPIKTNPDSDGMSYGNLLVETAAGRWGNVADMFLAQIATLAEQGEARAELHAFASVCLRNAGRINEANAHEEWVELLALGDIRVNLSIAQAFAFGRDYDRSSLWFRRAVIEANPDDSRFKQALQSFVNEMLEQRDFSLIAACTEILALLEVADTQFGISPIALTRLRQQADFAHALSLPPGQSNIARKMLRDAHAIMPSDGALADHFFPSLFDSPFRDLIDELFDVSWRKITASLVPFPDSDNTMNTAVWFASRSVRRLDDAKKLQLRALEIYPRNPAYLDTLAEVHFALGNRPEAIRLGTLAMRFMPHDSMIIRQYERFLNGRMPAR